MRTRLVYVIAAATLIVGACSSTPAANTPVASAPGSAAASAAAATGGTIKVGVTREPPSLDPAADPVCCGYELSALYDTLVAIQPDGTIGPDLAESWTVDGPSITFKLRTGVKFHDGTDFNAQAVKAYFDRLVDPATKAANATSVLGPYASSTVVDDHTVTVTWKNVYAAALVNIANTSLGIPSPTAAAAGTLAEKPVGTGPFKFVEWAHGDHLTLERNPDYTTIRPDAMNKGAAKVDRVVLQYVGNATTRANLVDTGGLDLTAVEGPDVARLEKGGTLKTFKYPTIFVRWFGMNTQHLSDIKVREAIASAIDRAAIVTAGAGGLATPHYSTVNSLAFGYDGSVDSEVPHFDLDHARQLMQDAGWTFANGAWSKGGQAFPELTLLTFSVDPYKAESQLVQDQLAQLGIKVKVDALETTTAIKQAIAGNFDLYLARYGMFDAGTMTALFHSKNIPTTNPNGNNITFFSDTKLDALLDAADKETDIAKRADLLHQAQHQLASDNSTFTIYEQQAELFYSPRVSGVRVFQDGALRLAELSIAAS